MSDDKPADIGLWVTVLVLVGAIVLLFAVLLNTSARSEELSEVSVTNAAFCSLHAREMTFIDVFHGPSLTADTDYILARAKEHYANCLAILPALMPLPDDTGSLQTWLADIRDLLVLTGKERVADVGTAPASESPSDEVHLSCAPGPCIKPGTPEADDWCRQNYRSYNPDDGTVVRQNSNGGRVPCPV